MKGDWKAKAREILAEYSDRVILRVRCGQGMKGGFWCGPIIGYRNTRVARVLFLQWGFDPDFPLQPWPRRLTERRGQRGGSIAHWYSLAGFCLGYQHTAPKG